MRHVNVAASLPGGAYSHAVVDGDHVWLAGQLAADRADGAAELGDIEAETRQCLDLLGAVLADVGLGFGDVVRVGVYLTDLREFDRMNAVYETYFEPGRRPARTTVGVAELLFGCRIEIDCVARRRP